MYAGIGICALCFREQAKSAGGRKREKVDGERGWTDRGMDGGKNENGEREKRFIVPQRSHSCNSIAAVSREVIRSQWEGLHQHGGSPCGALALATAVYEAPTVRRSFNTEDKGPLFPDQMTDLRL